MDLVASVAYSYEVSGGSARVAAAAAVAARSAPAFPAFVVVQVVHPAPRLHRLASTALRAAFVFPRPFRHAVAGPPSAPRGDTASRLFPGQSIYQQPFQTNLPSVGMIQALESGLRTSISRLGCSWLLGVSWRCNDESTLDGIQMPFS